MKDDRVYLHHLEDCIERITEYTRGGLDPFLADTMTQDAVLRNLEVIGEAVKNLSPNLTAAHPEIPWKRIAGLRDILIHHYFGVDLEIVWRVVEDRLPELSRAVADLLGPGS